MTRPIGRNIVAVCQALESGPKTETQLGQYLEGWGYEKARQYARRAVQYGFATCDDRRVYTVKPDWLALVDTYGVSTRSYTYTGRAAKPVIAPPEPQRYVVRPYVRPVPQLRNSVFDVRV